MERLTKRNEDGSVEYAKNCKSGCEYLSCSMEEGYSCEHQCEADAICKLADYEDAEEQGLLLRLPCKVGDTVYLPYKKECYKYVVAGFQFYEGQIQVIERSGCRIGVIGKDVFLTKEEAERIRKD